MADADETAGSELLPVVTLSTLQTDGQAEKARWSPARFRPGPLTEAAAVVTGMAGLLASMADGFTVRTTSLAASDFKTLFASTYLFARGKDAYAVSGIAHVLQAQGIIQPESWFARAAVYPPFTLTLLAPVTLLPLVSAAWLWLALSAVLFAAALYRIVRVAADRFELGLVWRFAIIALVLALPMLSLALTLGNVSVVVGSLCILVMLAEARGRWWQALALTVAILLKPHIAIWLLPALWLTHSAGDRRTARRTGALCLLFCAGIALCALWNNPLAHEFSSYRAVLRTELGSGSMSAAALGFDFTGSQVVGLHALLGYWFGDSVQGTVLAVVLLLALAGLLFAAGGRTRADADPSSLREYEQRLLLLNGWLALGLVATYHRAHDSLALYALLPWIGARLQRRPRSLVPWLLLGGLVALSLDLRQIEPAWLLTQGWMQGCNRLLQFRQAAAAAFAVAIVLAATAWRTGRRPRAAAAM